jgi:hypothetical protein
MTANTRHTTRMTAYNPSLACGKNVGVSTSIISGPCSSTSSGFLMIVFPSVLTLLRLRVSHIKEAFLFWKNHFECGRTVLRLAHRQKWETNPPKSGFENLQCQKKT